MTQPDEQIVIIRELFDAYADSLYRYAKYSLPDDIDPRDVVQEVFLRAFRSWNDFQGQSSAKTWLFRIARNHIYDLLRKKRRRREIEQIGPFSNGFVELDTIVELEDALSRLQPTYQQILNLRWLQDMSVAETAEVLNCSETKVRVTFHRAKKKLKALLDDPDELFLQQHYGGGDNAREGQK